MRGFRSYETILLILLAVTVLVTVVASANDWIVAFGPNLATEVLGILITVMLIERALARERRIQRDQETAIALAGVGNRLKRVARELRRVGQQVGVEYRSRLAEAPTDEAARAARRALHTQLRSPAGSAMLAQVRGELGRIEDVVNNFSDLPEPYVLCVVHSTDSLDQLSDYLKVTPGADEADDLMPLAYSLQVFVRQVSSLVEETRRLSDSAAIRIADAQLAAADEALVPLFVQRLPAPEPEPEPPRR